MMSFVISFLLARSLASAGQSCVNYTAARKMAPWDGDCDNSCPDVRRTRWEQLRDSHCFCDELCVVYSDCCTDEDEDDSARRHALPPKTFTCQLIEGLYSTALPVYVVHSCPDSWDDVGVRRSCERAVADDSGLFLDWFVSDDNLVLFRNFYCALCHGRLKVTYWKIRIACDAVVNFNGDLRSEASARALTDKLDEGVCHLQYEPPERANRGRFIRLCKPVIDSCSANWTDDCVREMCQGRANHPSFVYSKSRLLTFRNKYCALCNYVDDVTCDDVVINSFFQPTAGILRDAFYPLSIIFDLNPGGRPLAEYKIGTTSGLTLNRTVTKLRACPEQHVFDPFIASCRRVTCRSGFIFKDGRCEKSSELNVTVDGCQLMTLNQSEYVLLQNGSVFVNSSTTVYNYPDYEISSVGLLTVCSDFSQNFTQTEPPKVMMKFSEAQGIVSVIGQLISIIALTLTLLIYALLSKLHNLAGKCIICLSASLLTSQMLFLVGVSFDALHSDDAQSVCVTFAIATHFAFLCSFSWMNVMAFDICRIFSGSVHKRSPDGLRRRFYRYSAYAWSSPLPVVIVALLLDFASSPTQPFRPGYGEGLCWITNRRALFVFFALPVAVIITANVIMFVLTAVHISRVQKDTVRATGNADRYRYAVYVKISIVMGLTWIFAFVAAATDSEVLWYLFLVFNTLQGAFVFVAFVFTRQVRNMLSDIYRRVERTMKRRPEKLPEEKTLTTMTSHLSASYSNVAAHKT